jgi:hypothetical protein
MCYNRCGTVQLNSITDSLSIFLLNSEHKIKILKKWVSLVHKMNIHGAVCKILKMYANTEKWEYLY